MQQEYNKAMAILDRIEEKLDMMEKRLDKVIETINNKSSNTTTTTDEDYLSSTMYGVDNKQ